MAGGTGSHAAVALAYLGARDVLVLDDDHVEITNLNRLVTAGHADIDTPKNVTARRRMRELRFSSQETRDVGDLVFLHMRPHTFKMGWTDSAVRRYVRDAGPLLDLLNELVRCDVTTRNEKRARAIQRGIDQLEERIAELRQQEELDSLRAPIDGHQAMAHLGWEPGPELGKAMKMLLEHRIEHGPSSEEEAYRLLDEWKEAK